MKKLLFVFIGLILIAGAFCQGTAKQQIDPEIVGRWDYLKTVNEDGSEEFNMIGLEHYYADGTVIYIDMWVKPYEKGNKPDTHEELAAARGKYSTGLGTFETEKDNNLLRIRTVACTNPDGMGNSYEVKYEIKGDVIIFDGKYYFTRAR